VLDYFADWFPRVTRIQSEQPHWVTPIVTVTPRLEEEFRYPTAFETRHAAFGEVEFSLIAATYNVERSSSLRACIRAPRCSSFVAQIFPRV
jgi:hypothetical protein